MTRFGMGEAEMARVADLFRDCLMNDRSVEADCAALRSDFPEIRYGFGAADLDLPQS